VIAKDACASCTSCCGTVVIGGPLDDFRMRVEAKVAEEAIPALGFCAMVGLVAGFGLGYVIWKK